MSNRTPHTDRIAAARFILDEAKACGMHIGTDGDDLLIAPPRGMPRESYFSFQRAIIEHRAEVIDTIMADKGACNDPDY